jgi:hypothetical protein
MNGALTPTLIGQFLGTGLACGINLYAVVTALGLASRLGWTDALPPGLRGLEHPIVIVSAAVLFLAEAVVDKVPYLDSAWNAVHTIIRPIAAGLLAILALSPLPWSARLGGAAAAAAAALLVHASKSGLRVALRTTGRGALATRVSFAEDLVALALVAAVLLIPAVTAAIALAGCVVLLAKGPPLWRAAWLGARSVDGRLRAFFGSPGWRDRDDLPAHVARLVPPDDLGLAPPRALRAAVDRLPGTGAYRNGWVVVQREHVAFIYRSMLGTRRIEVPAVPVTHIQPGALVDTIRLDGPAGFTLFLLKDGPPLDVATAELNAASQ